MKYVLTCRQMQDCDQKTIQHYGVPSLVLMERAALACVEELLQLSPQKSSRILVVCGNGNNGGDGVAIARILKERGYSPEILMAGNRTGDRSFEQKLSVDCAKQLEIARAYGIAEVSRQEACEGLSCRSYDYIVDAMFGVGLSRPLDEHYGKLAEAINLSGAKVLAVDIPSGIHGNTGQCMGTAVRADVTVTFAFLKRGHLLYPGREYCGRCVLRDIGITEKALCCERETAAFYYEPLDLSKLPVRQQSSNKGTYGKVLMIAGSRDIFGAAYLAAIVAYKTGAGLVSLMTEETNRPAIQTMLPEALLTFYSDEDAALTKKLREKLSWSTVVGAGPGLGTGETAVFIMKEVLRYCTDLPLVIDADGLNILAVHRELLEELRRMAAQCSETESSGNKAEFVPAKARRLILTPHMGEMSRLTETSISEIKQDPIACAAEFARKYDCVCVLKDACTVVCDGQGRTYLNTSGNSGMSGGGSGDVLTGVICGLLAQGMEAFEAACLGVYLHGLAGDCEAVKKGEYSMMARDLLDGIEEIFVGGRQ